MHESGGASGRNFSTPALPLGAPTTLIASNKDDLAYPHGGPGRRLSLPSRAVLTLNPLAVLLGLVRRPHPARARMLARASAHERFVRLLAHPSEDCTARMQTH